jgi:hypothetical protein
LLPIADPSIVGLAARSLIATANHSIVNPAIGNNPPISNPSRIDDWGLVIG